MTTNFPTALDDDSSLYQVVNGVSAPLAEHHNNTKDALKALEAKVGIFNTSVPTSIDYRLGHPTSGHNHNGASGQGAKILATSIRDINDVVKQVVVMQHKGTLVATTNSFPPIIIGKNLVLESMQGALARGPSGATLAFDVKIGGTSVWGASPGLGAHFAPLATVYLSSATPNWITYPSGAVITVDSTPVGSSYPGRDAAITLVFRGQ